MGPGILPGRLRHTLSGKWITWWARGRSQVLNSSSNGQQQKAALPAGLTWSSAAATRRHKAARGFSPSCGPCAPLPLGRHHRPSESTPLPFCRLVEKQTTKGIDQADPLSCSGFEVRHGEYHGHSTIGVLHAGKDYCFCRAAFTGVRFPGGGQSTHPAFAVRSGDGNTAHE